MLDMNNDLKAQLKNILSRHEGRDNAITSRELSQVTGEPDRTIRLAIRELRADSLPVLSSGEGYFLPVNWAEVMECAASMKSRLIEDAKTRRDILRSATFYLTPAKQGRLI